MTRLVPCTKAVEMLSSEGVTERRTALFALSGFARSGQRRRRASGPHGAKRYDRYRTRRLIPGVASPHLGCVCVCVTLARESSMPLGKFDCDIFRAVHKDELAAVKIHHLVA